MDVLSNSQSKVAVDQPINLIQPIFFDPFYKHTNFIYMFFHLSISHLFLISRFFSSFISTVERITILFAIHSLISIWWCFCGCCFAFVVVVPKHFHLMLKSYVASCYVHTADESAIKGNDCDKSSLPKNPWSKHPQTAESGTWGKIRHLKFEACNSLKDHG